MDVSGLNLQANKNNLNIDRGSMIITYHKYQGYILPLVVLLISFCILFFVIFPEINQYSESKKQLDTETQKLDVLKNNYNFLVNIDDKKTTTNIKLLASVLPSEKDFLGIITAVTAASARSGIVLGNYKFSLGNLSKANISTNLPYPTILMTLETEGTALNLRDFLFELYRTAPLSEVMSIDQQDQKGTLRLQFYYKPFPPQSVSEDAPINKLNSSDSKLLDDLYSWNNAPIFDENGNVIETNVATPSPAFDFNSTSSSQASFSPFR